MAWRNWELGVTFFSVSVTPKLEFHTTLVQGKLPGRKLKNCVAGSRNNCSAGTIAKKLKLTRKGRCRHSSGAATRLTRQSLGIDPYRARIGDAG